MSYNILVVDDSETVRAVIAKALDISGVRMGSLFQAENGVKALEVLRKEWVDLVLADINMPVMGGVRLVEEMKGDAELRSTPVVIISTEGSATRINELKQKGISGFLRKPFAPEDLKKLVDSLLGEGRKDG